MNFDLKSDGEPKCERNDLQKLLKNSWLSLFLFFIDLGITN